MTWGSGSIFFQCGSSIRIRIDVKWILSTADKGKWQKPDTGASLVMA